MKIIHVTHSFFPYSYGGREKMVYEWCKNLSKENKVKIFTSSDNPFKLEIKKFENIKVYYLPSITINLISSIYRIPLTLFYFLLKEDFDICHVHDFHHFTTLISIITCRLKRKPVVLTYHGLYKNKGFLKYFIKIYEMFFLRLIRNSCKKIIVPSRFIRKEVINEYSIPREKIILVPNFISLNFRQFKKTNFKRKHNIEGKFILFVGRFAVEKGLNYLIRAFKQVFNKIREIKLVIIGGERSYIKAIEKLISKLRLNRGVVLIPNASDEELDAAFNSSELVVIPSIYEPFGNVALEAMKFGKPIVASRVGGLSEILVDGRNSLLVKAGSTKQIEEAILKVLKNKKLAIRMGKNNKKDVKKFDRKKYVEVVNNFYKEILNLN